MVKEETDRLVEAVTTIFQDFHNGFNLLCEEKATSNPNGKLVQAELRHNVAEARQILTGPMQRAYEALEKDLRGIGVNRD